MSLAPLVDAIYRQRVTDFAVEIAAATDTDAALAAATRAAAAACRVIGEQTDGWIDEVRITKIKFKNDTGTLLGMSRRHIV